MFTYLCTHILTLLVPASRYINCVYLRSDSSTREFETRLITHLLTYEFIKIALTFFAYTPRFELVARADNKSVKPATIKQLILYVKNNCKTQLFLVF